jgi:drug/metabolite transporter (DMT)-like permease
MDRLPAAVVSIYTFVNPVVAVFLGWLVFREPFGWRELAAMLLIFAGVAVVKFSGTAESRTILDSSKQVAVND